MSKCFNLDFDVALSFAGEDREFVEQTANCLRDMGIKVFYDKHYEIDLWGKNLYQYLDDIYQNKAKFTVVFVSKHYQKKLWTNHELESIQARAFKENKEYILPFKLDDTIIPGFRETTGHQAAYNTNPTELAKKIQIKLGKLEPKEFIPKTFKFIERGARFTSDEIQKHDIDFLINITFQTLVKTNDQERFLLTNIIRNSCWHDMDNDLHIDLNEIIRATNFSKKEIFNILNNLAPLGFEYEVKKYIHGKKQKGNLRKRKFLHLKLYALQDELNFLNLTSLITIIYLSNFLVHCETCSNKACNRLDFTSLKYKFKRRDIERTFQ